jgi:formylglycine-generating enzyme required for sulfatase activity
LKVGSLIAAGVAVALLGWTERDDLLDEWRYLTVAIPYRHNTFDQNANAAAELLKLGALHSFWDCAHDKDHCPAMVVIPAGSFVMGSPASDSERQLNEGPQHQVTIPKPFAIAKYATTFAEWDECATYGDCNPNIGDEGWGRGRRPVINVTWNDAQTYVAWLSQMTGKHYRLLSEAEYEYATRAGTSTARFWGDTATDQCRYANGDDQAARKADPTDKTTLSCDDGFVYSSPVGSFRPNEFGLYDMLGNVWDWTEDCYHASYSGAPTDGRPWGSGQCGHPVVRGGSWGNGPRVLRSAYRTQDSNTVKNYYDGFRVARTLDQ